MLTQQDIAYRIRVEGKDSNDQFAEEIDNFIRDACVEISTSQNYYWLNETISVTVPSTITDWIDLDDDFHKVEVVAYNDPNSGNDVKYFSYVHERDVVNQYNQLYVANTCGYYRLRWNADTNTFQICLINGPSAGSSIQILIKKWLKAPEQFPDFMEETLVKGGVGRMCTFLEGDDLEYGKNQLEEYRQLAKQQDKLGNNQLSRTPRRTKTNAELNQGRMLNEYRSQ